MSVKLTQDLIHAVDKNKIYKPHANMVNKILVRYLEGHRDMIKELHTNATPPPVATEEASPKRTYEQPRLLPTGNTLQGADTGTSNAQPSTSPCSDSKQKGDCCSTAWGCLSCRDANVLWARWDSCTSTIL
jgi:hypothetical protein